MESNYNENEKYESARKRVKEIKEFYGHLLSYVVVNLFLVAVNLLTSPEHLWFFWPMLGWGIGVSVHAMRVFNIMPFLGKDWEERKLKEFMEEEERRKNQWK
ncbi:2TM domain-containing protein [Flavobacterium sp. SM15]|uniref:2TM domain-containing protein n=1 Tax=Flavobacterium sp. SM15 TaxID=2908005 RepID=UPI001EDC8319|nr:2TM domain-containing protein [Flavobacterium sp. SM15]MCG2611052.1 2TM domain-containing protein [Flavobacterium sp. SM15]